MKISEESQLLAAGFEPIIGELSACLRAGRLRPRR